MAAFTLYGRPGWGSVLIETQLVWYGLDFDFKEVGHLFKDPAAADALRAVNPLAQIPTLVLPDGTVMTESAAVTLWLADHTGDDSLVPGPRAAERAAFLRWLIFFVANLYPTYTYADDPARFVSDPGGRAAFAEAVWDHGKRLYAMLEDQAAGPWFLGARFSALDIFVAAFTAWEPGPAWFSQNAPRLTAIASRTRAYPRLAAVWTRNTPTQDG
ncbi:MAG: glutathione S-transferase family protein [Alphaproteobacteria bacterium]